MFVKPGMGPSADDPKEMVVLSVRNPDTRRFLSKDGEEVPDTQFWHRLLRDGDVVLAEPARESPKTPALTATAAEAHSPEQAPAQET